MRPTEIAPSILSADFARLAEEVETVTPYAGRIHIDVMDGHFVPNLTMGPGLVASLRKVTKLALEVHLMVEHPQSFVQAFAAAGADRIVFHIEVVEDPGALVKEIQDLGVKAGVALNPQSSWEIVSGKLAGIDLVTVMTVNPGFGGQAFLSEVIPKIEQARLEVTADSLDVDIEVDGGIDASTIETAQLAGANVFVAGNAIFGSEDPAQAARELARLVGSRSNEGEREGF